MHMKACVHPRPDARSAERADATYETAQSNGPALIEVRCGARVEAAPLGDDQSLLTGSINRTWRGAGPQQGGAGRDASVLVDEAGHYRGVVTDHKQESGSPVGVE